MFFQKRSLAYWYSASVPAWSFLTNHARVLLCIAHDPGLRLRDIAARLDITERSVHGIITDLTAAGYVVKQKDGRRNRYQIQPHLPLPEPWTREPAIGEILTVLLGDGGGTARLADLEATDRRRGDPRAEVRVGTVNAGGSDALGSRTTRAASSADPPEGEPRPASS
jgi:DNA-binding transcriptional ArsR family regulator